MEIYASGTLRLSRPLTEQEMKKVFEACPDAGVSGQRNTIEFMGNTSIGYADEAVVDIENALAPFGVSIPDGESFHYYGDYEGSLRKEHGKWKLYESIPSATHRRTILCGSCSTVCRKREDRDMEEWFGIVKWCDDDVGEELFHSGIEPSPENVAKVRSVLENGHALEDAMIEAGRDVIRWVILDTDFPAGDKSGVSYPEGGTQ